MIAYPSKWYWKRKPNRCHDDKWQPKYMLTIRQCKVYGRSTQIAFSSSISMEKIIKQIWWFRTLLLSYKWYKQIGHKPCAGDARFSRNSSEQLVSWKSDMVRVIWVQISEHHLFYSTYFVCSISSRNILTSTVAVLSFMLRVYSKSNRQTIEE